jgi:hypothetical protein
MIGRKFVMDVGLVTDVPHKELSSESNVSFTLQSGYRRSSTT